HRLCAGRRRPLAGDPVRPPGRLLRRPRGRGNARPARDRVRRGRRGVVGPADLAAAGHRRAAPAPPRYGPDVAEAAMAGSVIIAMTVAPTALRTVVPTIVAPTIA